MLRIVQADNFQIKRFGATKVATGRKLFYGFIRNGFAVQEFSERDLARFLAPFGWRTLGKRAMNRKLIETCDNFRPDFLMLGHCDLIANATLAEIRRLCRGVRIGYRNVDPLFEPGNIDKIANRVDAVDAIFLTTAGDAVARFASRKTLVSYMPNPTDPSVETARNHEKEQFEIDLLFCGIGEKHDPRYPLIGRLKSVLDGQLRFSVNGMHGTPPIYGRAYDEALAKSKMGLNLNRREGDALYTSARISQLMGSGLVTFLNRANGLSRFFSDDEAVFFDDEDELIDKILMNHRDDDRRRAVAANGWRTYHLKFSAQKISRYVVELSLGQPLSENYCWADLIYKK